MADSIGGYFEVELVNDIDSEFESKKVFSSGRSAFAYLLRSIGVEHIQLPIYRCDALIEPLNALNVSFSFYTIGKDLLPDFTKNDLDITKPFLIINYFGLLDKKLKTSDFLKLAIVDNTQALYSNVEGGLGSFNSYRKFIGVCDGGEVRFGGNLIYSQEPRKTALNEINYLFGRFEASAEDHYVDYLKAEASHKFTRIRSISRISQLLYSKTNHKNVQLTRRRNFNILNTSLVNSNNLCFSELTDEVPVCYPYLTDNANDLRMFLLKNKVYTASYWKNNSFKPEFNSFAGSLQKNLLALPIDQRYSVKEMRYLIKLISDFERRR
jgi:hypothetical protein